jgi:hypothetical protein
LSYPTVAAIPSIDNLYSQQEIGGFFAPNNLGASKYINQNYTTHLEISSQTTQNYFENIKERFNARGLTKESSNTPYVLDSENNLWIKESNVSSSTAGTTKKEIFKKYQKFLPYQSGYESNPRLKVGLVTPSSKQTPWTGKEDSEWGDISNYPISFTGELKTSKWVNDQVLKKSGLQAENWVTDIYGNQYALYKNIKNVPSIQRKNVYGEIWTRKNSQFVSSASNSLVGVFDTYSNTTLIHELTGKGIKKIDVFFDTLMIETSGAVIFEKLIYDYNTDNIFSLTDEARYISLAMPLSINLDREFNNVDVSNYNFAKAGETWFFPKEKIVSISTCSVENKKIVPELYSLNLNSVVLEKIFPLIDTDITLINSLSSENIISVESPTLSYNSFSSEYILSVLCKTEENNDLLLELIIKNNSRPFIKNCTIYKSKPKDLSLNPPIIQHSLHVYITNKEELNFQSYADNGPVTYSVIEKPDWVKVSSNGLFTGTPPTIGTYKVTFTVTNSYGPVYYTLYVYVEKALIIDYLYTSGYTQIGDEDGFILSEPEIGTGENKIILNIIES